MTVEALEDRRLLTGFVVDTLLDNPSEGSGDTDGLVSLREAITAANTNLPFGDAPAGEGGDIVDQITFDASRIDQPIVLGGVELTVSGDLSITGLGANNLTISGNSTSRIFRIDADVNVNISDVTITGGEGGAGGAIYSDGTLGLANTVLSQNHASFGGAIRSNGVLNIAASVFSGNKSDGHAGAIGYSGDTLTIAGTTFSENEAGGAGGAIDLWDSESVYITDSNFSNNSARYGGAIDNVFSTLTVANSTLFGNSADRLGGAIYTAVGNVKLVNSTISGNASNEFGGGIWNSGPLEITNSTLTANRADIDGDGWGEGGGLYSPYSDPSLNNTILAGNFVGAPGSDRPDDICGAVDLESSYNLIGDPVTAGGLTHGANGNIVGNEGSEPIDITTVLDTNLADNGGPTLTHVPVPDGLAVNKGDNSKAVDADGAPLVYDQRGEGFARIFADIVDIGAFEVQPLSVQIDVKPGSDSNPVNLAANGVIAVAILTTEEFNASQVDVGSVLFAGAGAVHSALEDVDSDGDLDLVLHFRIEDTILDEIYAQLLADDLKGDGVLDSTRREVELSLTGETLEGASFEGCDAVDLMLSGKALRALLEELAANGAI